MNKIYDDLYQTDFDRPFAWNRYKTCAYLLLRQQGNYLIYNSRQIKKHFDFIHDHGGVKKQFICHQDEAFKSCDDVREFFDAPLFCPQAEKEAIQKRCHVDGTFNGDERIFQDFDIIFTPGHTPGSSCFLWTTEKRKILFTGENLFLNETDHFSVFLQKENVKQAIQSLEKLRDIEVDTIVPGGFFNQIATWELVPGEWENIIGAIISRLRRGETR